MNMEEVKENNGISEDAVFYQEGTVEDTVECPEAEFMENPEEFMDASEETPVDVTEELSGTDKKKKAKKEKPVREKKSKKEKPLKKEKKSKKEKPLKKEKKGKKVKAGKMGTFSKFQSVKAKVYGLVIVGVLVSVVAIMILMISYVKELVINSAYGKMLNVSTSYGKLIEKAEEPLDLSKWEKLSPEQIKEVMSDVEISGLDNFFYFVMSNSGITLYHTDESRIGKPNTIRVITTVTENIHKGIVSENLCLEYDEDGVHMYASYYVTENRSLVVFCATETEIMRPIIKMVAIAVITAISIIAVIVLISNFVIRKITNPLNQVTEIISDTAQLKIKLPDNIDALCERNDETGTISRAVREMSNNLRDVVNKIDVSNNTISTNMGKLESSSNQVHIFCTDNSATTQQIAASAEQVSDMTQMMSSQVVNMREQAEEIGKETESSNQFSAEVAGRAKAMQISTQKAIGQTKDMYEQIKERTAVALEGLNAVSKINALTDTISEIADQTSLLSLNASIEAARAGDAGRGFAVVAQEISKLAHRSLESVSDINKIIKEVNVAVDHIEDSMEDTTEFLEKNVLADYDGFNQISAQYMADADTFKAGMDHISEQIVELNTSIQTVSEAVENISGTMKETSMGVTDIAEKTSNVVSATSDNYNLTNDTVGRIQELRNIVDRFEFE